MPDQRNGGIAWTDETWNPIRGCSDVNDDCRYCYAKVLAATRMSGPGQSYHGLAEERNGKAYWTGKVQLVDDILLKPLGWTRPRKVFVNSMSDLFHPALTYNQIDQVVAVMALAHRHTFQVLTKRPERMAEYFHLRYRKPCLDTAIQATMDQAPRGWHLGGAPYAWPLPNVWWGASMGHQGAVEEFIPHLLACRDHAAVLWVSAEPLIEHIDLALHRKPFLFPKIDWLVVGGESGKDARPMHPSWPKDLQRDCAAAGVAFHFKQWGSWRPVTYLEPNTQQPMLNISCDGTRERVVSSGDPRHRDDINMVRGTKKMAGRKLDGRTWDQWPITAVTTERIS